MAISDGLYARASKKMEEQSYQLKGQWFFKSDACEACGVSNRPEHKDYREAIGQVLYNWVHLKKPVLEQQGKRYRFIIKEFKIIKPGNPEGKRFEMSWPRGIKDNSSFGFADTLVITKGDVIGLGGEGNKGKSCFALNLAVENMDKHKVTLILSENIQRLDERLSHFDWVNVLSPEGDWKFEVIEARSDREFLDIVRERKDNLVIIDWLNVSKDAYLVSNFYEALTNILGDGVAVAVQQKRSYKDYVVGGEAALDFSSVFFYLMENKISVAKAKVWDYQNPNNTMFHFDIIKNGSQFSSIFEIMDCPQCKGKETYRGDTCGRCYGKGYLEKRDKF